MPLFDVKMPASAEIIFKILFQIASFETIPTEAVFEGMLAKLEDVTPSDPQIEKYERLGFGSVWLLPNLGSLLLFVSLYPIMLVVLFIQNLLTECFSSGMHRRDQFRDIVFWNWPINLLRESWIVIALCCLINIRYASWSVQEATLNSTISYAILALICLYPALTQFCLHKWRDHLR